MCIPVSRYKAAIAALTICLMGLGHTTSAAVALIDEDNLISVFGAATAANGEDAIERRRFSTPLAPGDFDELVETDISIDGYSAKGTAQQTSRISTTSISASGATTASTGMPLDTSIGGALQDSNTTLSVIFEVETPQLFDLSGLVSSSKFDGGPLGNLFGQADISLTSSVGFFDLSFRAQMPDLLGTETIPFHESGTLLPEIYTLSVSTVTGANSDRDDPVMSGATDFSVDLNFAPVPIPAAAWLFGSGLLGLVGIARRNKAA